MNQRKKYFFLMHPEESLLKGILDSIRFIVDPSQKNHSHITLKGPYSKKVEKIFKRDNEKIAGKTIRIKGSGCFFNESQNTVFLSCVKTSDLEDVWRSQKEKTYKEFHPHITIYDGRDREYAQQLLNIFSRYDLNFELNIDGLLFYESKSSRTSLFNLESTIDLDFINSISKTKLDRRELLYLNSSQRLLLVENICQFLAESHIASA